MEGQQVADRIQIRRDTAANWTSANPTLTQGELGVETDTQKLKIGDGSTAWTSLSYLVDTGGYAAYADSTANFTGNLQKSGASVAAYSDSTANFTGALQKSGVPVAADANLNSFLSAVDLPVADGSADQVLTTTGSGTLQFADAAGGVSYDNWNAGSNYVVPLQSASDISAGRTVSSPAYVQLWRVGSANTSNHTVGSTFAFISGNHNSSSSQTSFTACGLVVTPSTKTISITTPDEIWANSSGYGVSTWAGTGCDGGGEMVCHGNISWPFTTTYKMGYAIYRQSNTTGENVNNNMGGFTGDSHQNNEPRFSLPYNSSGATRAFVTGYDQNSSSQAAYRTYSGSGVGSNGSISSVNSCPQTNTSTVETVNMFTHPLITNAGLFPNSGSFNLPTSICTYGTANGYSKIALDAGNNVGSEVTTGFDRSQYNNQCAFLVKDPSSNNLKLFNYDYYGQICEWTSTTQTYDRGNLGSIPFALHMNKYMIIPTGNLNEYLTLNTVTNYPYYAPFLMIKFTINYSDGKFSNLKIYDASKNTDMMVFNGSYVWAKALYGDNDDISSAPTHILFAGLKAGNSGFAQVTDYPADSLFTAI
ncbi:MAG: hypothetical protein CMB25_01785 [Euryarchaeota archaeon]|nr:hypothetical protein [Euryarchaeota archaeon]|tara:strand:+ start:4271 stop:6040 length:1770 start_codon:yes stop_codon:yes gene_type:complete